MMSISPDSIVVATDAQVSTALGNETVILHFGKGSYFGLNEVGSAIWGKLRQPRTVSELCNAVLDEFDVEAETCRQDVVTLLEKLQAEGLVEVRNDPAV